MGLDRKITIITLDQFGPVWTASLDRLWFLGVRQTGSMESNIIGEKARARCQVCMSRAESFGCGSKLKVWLKPWS